MRKKLQALIIVATVTAMVAGWAHSRQAEQPATVMRVKLAHAQNVLDALATGDFEKLSADAHRLKLLSEEAAWNVIQTPEYRQYSNEFRHATDELSVAAKNKSIDGAVLAYFGLTMKCVNCHKYVRQTQP
jgi:hypothetical protein